MKQNRFLYQKFNTSHVKLRYRHALPTLANQLAHSYVRGRVGGRCVSHQHALAYLMLSRMCQKKNIGSLQCNQAFFCFLQRQTMPSASRWTQELCKGLANSRTSMIASLQLLFEGDVHDEIWRSPTRFRTSFGIP